MADIPPTSTPKPNRLAQIASLLLGTVQLPGWAMLVLAIIIGVPDWKSRYEFWLATAAGTGSKIAVLAPILAHPYLPGILAVAGVIYLVIVGAPGKSAIRHKWLPVVGWIAFTVCFSAIIATAGFGWIELYIRSEIAKGVAGMPRGAPDENTPQRQQRPLTAISRNIQPDQARILKQEIPKLRQYFTEIGIVSMPNDIESYQLSIEYQIIFNRSGILTHRDLTYPKGPDDEGIIISYSNDDNAKLNAQKLKEAFEIANIRARITEESYTASSGLILPKLTLFIAPNHVE